MNNNPQLGTDTNGIKSEYRWCTYHTQQAGPCGMVVWKYLDEDSFDNERCQIHKDKIQKTVRKRKKRFSGYSNYQAENGGFQRSSRA